jgi:hypothetical protein
MKEVTLINRALGDWGSMPGQIVTGTGGCFAKNTDSSLQPADVQWATKIRIKAWHLFLQFTSVSFATLII